MGAALPKRWKRATILSFIPEDLPAPFLTYLKASLESPPSRGPALLPGRVRLSKDGSSKREDFILSLSSLTATIIII